MNYIKQLDGATCFVGLQMPDQMPAGRVAAGFGNLAFSFLHAILAEVSYAGGDRLANDFRRMGFADRHQSDFIRRSIASERAGLYSAAHGFDAFTQGGSGGGFYHSYEMIRTLKANYNNAASRWRIFAAIIGIELLISLLIMHYANWR